MKIAMIGQKGIPATYGGIERHVEELSVRLAALGHAVTVYTRPHYSDKATHKYHGVHLVSLPSVATKHLDAISHAVVCTAHAIVTRADVVHYHGVGPALLSWIPHLCGRKVVVTFHAQDAKRPKWGRLASRVLRVGEWMAVRAPNATVCVSETLSAKLTERYQKRIEFIPNGVSLVEGSDDSILSELGLEPGQYLLFAGRLVPEKGCHYLVRAWKASGTDMKLVVAGDSSFSPDYIRSLQAEPACAGVVFPGYVYGERLASLFRSAALFVLPSDLEGLPIVLLEALGYGTPVLASDITPNVEVLGTYGRTFSAGSTDDLAAELLNCISDLASLKTEALAVSKTIAARYDWDVVTAQTADVYSAITGID
jgi:glycosyltransferase involved in cell wall biosynthesis